MQYKAPGEKSVTGNSCTPYIYTVDYEDVGSIFVTYDHAEREHVAVNLRLKGDGGILHSVCEKCSSYPKSDQRTALRKESRK